MKRIGWVLLCLASVGCSESGGESTTTIVEGAPGRVSDEPRLAVGILAGDTLQEFDRVVTPFLLPDGGLVVPLQGAAAIRVFDAEGRFVESKGRPGEGPGEFQNLRSAWARGDTIEASDSDLKRITRFLPDGEVEVVTFTGNVPLETAAPGALPEGWVVTGIEVPASGGRDQVVVHGLSKVGDHIGELGSVEGFNRIAGEGVAGPHPLSPRSIIRVNADRIFVGETETPEIQVWDFQGDLVRPIEWEADEPTPPAEALEIVRQADLNPFYQRLVADAPVPERLSVFWDFLVDELGFVWVLPYAPSRHALALGGGGRGARLDGTWKVLSPEGEEVAEVQVPAGLQPKQITADAVVGIWRDSLGVEFVHVYDLIRN